MTEDDLWRLHRLYLSGDLGFDEWQILVERLMKEPVKKSRLKRMNRQALQSVRWFFAKCYIVLFVFFIIYMMLLEAYRDRK